PPRRRDRAVDRDGVPVRAVQYLEQGFLQRAGEKGPARVPPATLALHLPGGVLDHRRRLPTLPAADATHRVARLAERELPRALARGPQIGRASCRGGVWG